MLVQFFLKLREIAMTHERRVLAIEFEVDKNGDVKLTPRYY